MRPTIELRGLLTKPIVLVIFVLLSSISFGGEDVSVAESLRVADGVLHPLISIEAGEFEMGRNSSFVKLKIVANWEADNGFTEGPARRVQITKGYLIGRYKVTCEEYCVFLNDIKEPQQFVTLNDYSRIELQDGNYQPRKGCDRFAVNVVPWKGAVEFCKWLSRRTGRSIRLPTEAEWEFAARGPEGRLYPWGRHELEAPWDIDGRDREKYPHRWSGEPVDAFPAHSTPNGIVGMAAHVGEWCSDYYGIRYLPNDCVDPQGPRKEDLPVPSGTRLIAPFQGEARVLRRTWRGPRVTQRQPGSEVMDAGVYGFRIVVESPMTP